MNKEANLLFGVFGVQLKQFSAQQLSTIASDWASAPDHSIASRMIGAGILSKRDSDLLVSLVNQAIHAHGGDGKAALAAFGGNARVQEAFLNSLPADLAQLAPPVPEDSGLATSVLISSHISAVTETQGRYSQISEHGRGGFGRVLLVHDQHLERDIALKELMAEALHEAETVPEFGDAPSPTSIDAVRRFLQEARITGQLEHPSVVPVYELGRRQDGTLYYTMRFVRGVTMLKALREARSLTKRMELLSNFVDLCHAIAYAHSRGVIHRDIKPTNIMVGHFGETVVLDWGLAKALRQEDIYADEFADTIRLLRAGDDRLSGYTTHGRAMGTPAYMSPEQAFGELKNVDEKSDIYSLGAVLYELLTGQPPYAGSGPREILEKVVSELPPPISKIEPMVPPELVAICNHAMARDRDDRYASAEALAEDVTRFQVGAFVKAYHYSPAQRVSRFVKRHRTILATIVCATIALVSVAAVYHFRVAHQRGLAIAAQHRAETSLYRVGLLLAQTRIGQHRYDLAQAALDTAPGSLKNWEWRYLSRICNQALYTIREHYAPVEFLASSRDGTRVVTASLDGASRVVDVQSGKVLHVLAQHSGAINSVVFAPSGARILTSSSDATAILWDAQFGTPIVSLNGHEADIWDAAFSPDGSLLATAGSRGALRVWSAVTGALVANVFIPGTDIRRLAFSRDGQQILTATSDGVIRLWLSQTGYPAGELRQDNDPFTDADFSPAFPFIVAVSEKGSLSLWDSQTLLLLASRPGNGARIKYVELSPDGRFAISGDAAGAVHLWDLGNLDSTRLLRGHTDMVVQAHFNSSSTLAVTASLDCTARVWDVSTGDTIAVLEGHSAGVTDACFSLRDSRVITCSDDTTVRVWDLVTPPSPPMLPGQERYGSILGMQYSPNGRSLLSFSQNLAVTLWDPSDAKPLAEFREQRDIVSRAVWSGDSHRFATASEDGSVAIIDAPSRERLALIKTNSGPVRGLDFSPDGSRIVTGAANGDARVWDSATGAELVRLDAPPNAALTVTLYDPLNRYILIANDAGASALVNAHDGKRVRSLSQDKTPVLVAAFKPGGGHCVVANADGSVMLFPLEGGAPGLRLSGHQRAVTSASFCNDGSRIVTSSEDATARIWDVQTGAPLGVLEGHAAPVWNASFSPDGSRIVTASEDGSARVWDSASGQELCVLSGHEDALTCALFSPDGSAIATCSRDGCLRIWFGSSPRSSNGSGAPHS